MNLTEFRATRRDVTDLNAALQLWFDAPTAGHVYDGDCYIENHDGHLNLQLYNDGFVADSRTPDGLASLEAILYTWCLSESGREWDIPEDVRKFIIAILDCMTYDEFAEALTANFADPHSGVCHFQTYCDVNQVVLDCTNDDMDAATALYDAASPWLRGVSA